MKQTIPFILLGLSFVFNIGLLLERNEQIIELNTLDAKLVEAQQLPSIEDIQKRIGTKPDGIWGKETSRLYDKALCSQYASQYSYNTEVK